MELEIYLKYKAFTRAEILRKDDVNCRQMMNYVII